MLKLKKYPITYKGQEYEVRWENVTTAISTICIYKVTKNIFGIKTYKYIHGTYESLIIGYLEDLNIRYNSKDLYIEEIKMLFKLWETKKEIDEEKEQRKRNQQNALEQWNGVIES